MEKEWIKDRKTLYSEESLNQMPQGREGKKSTAQKTVD